MRTVKFQFVLWVAMETVIFYIAKMSFFLKTFFSHLVGPSEQMDTHDKLSWGCKIG